MPTGRKPAARTSRYSSTERSDVKNPAWPRCKRVIAIWGSAVPPGVACALMRNPSFCQGRGLPRPRLAVQRQNGFRLLDLVVGAHRLDGGAHGIELDRVATPDVGLLLDRHADDALGPELAGLLLHAAHGELAGLVDGLGEVGHLDVLAHVVEPGTEPLISDVVDAGPHHQRERPVTGLDQGPEVVPGQVRSERPAACGLPLATARRADIGA